MKAAARTRYGPPEVVRIADVEKPTPGEHEVLVAVAHHLARDRRRRPVELGRDGRQRRALGQAAGDLLAFCQ